MSTHHEKKENIRVQITKKMIWKALITLLERRNFESLSVQEICDQATVHRTTFYKHFEDKYALISYGLIETQRLIEQKSPMERLFHPMQTFEEAGLLKEVAAILHSEQENKYLINIIQKQAFESLLADLQSFESLQDNRSEIPLDFMASIFSGTFAAAIMYWVNNQKNCNAKEIDGFLNRIITKDMFKK